MGQALVWLPGLLQSGQLLSDCLLQGLPHCTPSRTPASNLRRRQISEPRAARPTQDTGLSPLSTPWATPRPLRKAETQNPCLLGTGQPSTNSRAGPSRLCITLATHLSPQPETTGTQRQGWQPDQPPQDHPATGLTCSTRQVLGRGRVWLLPAGQGLQGLFRTQSPDTGGGGVPTLTPPATPGSGPASHHPLLSQLPTFPVPSRRGT